MSSSSSLSGRKVDVFLSFCCKTSQGYFQEILFQYGIKTFKSNWCWETRYGPIDQQTLEALEESKVAVVMTSETKPCSFGFLEELIVILKFYENGSITVIPIFLNAYSFNVEEICQQYPEKAPSWKTALTKLTNIVDEYPFSRNLVGMGQSDWLKQIAHDIFLLLLKSLAFGVVQVLGKQHEARSKHRKVLLIADDVNNIEQGKWVIEYANWFAPGSRVILISQNKNLLVDAGVKHVYEVRSLRYDEALQLFSHFAFKQPYPPSDFEQLAVRAVHLAGFLPLGLRLLGSFLTGRGREEWVAALLKLKAKQGGKIMEVWKLMEPPGNKVQEEWEAAADLMERKESLEDKDHEEWEAAPVPFPLSLYW